MYNRYIPEDVSYTRVEDTPAGSTSRGAPRRGQPRPFRLPELLAGKEGLFGALEGKLLPSGEGAGLSGLLKLLHLESIDSGDVLLLLIMLYLLVEGDDLELVIALGLTLLMGLGENEKLPD